jgi:hypothetical protein
MIEILLSLPTWIGCAVMTGFTAVVGFVVYLVFYKLISKYQREGMHDPTTNLFRVVGTIVSLMLALAFSEVIDDMRSIRNAVRCETMACFGVYRPQATCVALVSLYMIFVGLVLFLIMKLSDPFQGDIGVTPAAFEYLAETLQSNIR